jgi:D-glycero-D-manno-heptose 1,7-bisphosphate phosphatase
MRPVTDGGTDDGAGRTLADGATDLPESARERRVPVLYVDIDGTIRWGKDELGRFVNTADDVRVFDGVADLLWRYKKLGWRVVGVSNQGGIALGIMDIRTCAAAMMETHRQTREAFDRLLWCQHHPNASDPEMAVCWCRKPRAGLVIEGALALAEQHAGEIYPPHLGLFVGDRPEDAACAGNAGLAFMAADVWRSGKHLEALADA